MGVKTRKLSQINDSLIEWQSVVVADGSTGLTAEAGRGYFINTTAGAITVTFPASPKIGDTIIINDYASTFNTNNVIINFNGNKLEADTTNATLSTNDQTHTFVFTDATQGWKIVNQDTGTNIQPAFISATGGTVTTDGDFKTHVFTGDGSFVVSCAGNASGSNSVEYLVIAGGGGGGFAGGGGGGGGGFRQNYPSPTTAGLPVTATSFPITVGGGGNNICSPGAGGKGNDSVFSTITSTGGGLGGGSSVAGGPGGSGGGGGQSSGGTGNTPPVSPPQGNNGGSNPACGAGGGAAGAVGGPRVGGAGSPIATTFFGPTAPSYGTPGPAPGRYFAGGGTGNEGGVGGVGGGGDSLLRPTPASAQPGTINTGGGGGGYNGNPGGSGAGGSGIVVIRYKFQ